MQQLHFTLSEKDSLDKTASPITKSCRSTSSFSLFSNDFYNLKRSNSRSRNFSFFIPNLFITFLKFYLVYYLQVWLFFLRSSFQPLENSSKCYRFDHNLDLIEILHSTFYQTPFALRKVSLIIVIEPVTKNTQDDQNNNIITRILLNRRYWN